MCGAPSTVTHLDHIVVVLRRSPAPVASSSPSSRRRADETLRRRFAGSKLTGHHRAERVLNSEVPCVRYMDRSDRENVRLHLPRCHNASAYGLRGYMDNTLPSRFYASPKWILRVHLNFFKITVFPISGIRARSMRRCYMCWGMQYFKKIPTITQDLSRRCIATSGESVSTYPRRLKAEGVSTTRLMYSYVFTI